MILGALALTVTHLAGQAKLPDSVSQLRSRAEFDALARPNNYPYPLPHLFFVVDRLHHNRLYYVNSKRYDSHRAFCNATYISLETGQTFFANNYLRPNRRFYMGTLGYQTPVKRWTFEFWEGDQITPAGVREVATQISKTFFAPVALKPNSLLQEEASVEAKVPRLLASEISPPADYIPLSLASAVGRLRILDKFNSKEVIRPDEIVVLPEAPVDLPPVAGIITIQPASPLSHISLRSKAMRVPDAYIKNAAQLLKSRNGQVVEFVTTGDQYLIGKPTAAELKLFGTALAQRKVLLTPKADLSVTSIADLADQRARMVTVYGAKSANLGEMLHAHITGMDVPDGFSLPFSAYRDFVVTNGLDHEIAKRLADPAFRADSAVRQAKLAELRAAFNQGKLRSSLAQEVLRRAHARFAGEGIFVRSSTNSEDLPNFNGAGLYSTFPNARTDEQILQAIKFVWASVWNFEAFEARERAGIDHKKVYMAVLLQRAINAESTGVMITGNPFNPGDHDCCYISATKGLGIKVVEGVKIPEQLLLHYESSAVQVLTRSTIDSLLTFDPKGGLREVAVPSGRTVLTDALVHGLAKSARRIQTLFGGKEQDIEWTIMGGKIYVVQSRPYLRG